MTHIINYTLKIGCLTNITVIERKSQNVENSIESILSLKPKAQDPQLKKMNFDDMRLLCLGAVHSNFTKSQMEKFYTYFYVIGKSSKLHTKHCGNKINDFWLTR